MNTKTIHLPGLNGLRAIAAISVVFSHITLELHNFNLHPFIFDTSFDGATKGLDLAIFGVTIFFTLSGFLITYLLLKEKQVQEINIKHFYFRRILRIWPLYYLYLIVVLIIMLVSGTDINLKCLFFYLFYLANVPSIINNVIPFLSHYWSLGVEEQFYAFWPWFVKKINGKLSLVIGFIILLMISAKLFLHFFYPNSIIESAINITRFHCMLIGAIGAVLYLQNNSLFLKISDNKITQLMSLLIIGLVAINQFHIATVLDNEIISVVSLLIIIGQINIKNRLLNFDISIFDFLGKISYGIYVIHPLIIYFSYKVLFAFTAFEGVLKYILIYAVTLGLTILVSHLSYEYFEKYFLKLKENISAVKSSGTKYFKGS